MHAELELWELVSKKSFKNWSASLVTRKSATQDEEAFLWWISGLKVQIKFGYSTNELQVWACLSGTRSVLYISAQRSQETVSFWILRSQRLVHKTDLTQTTPQWQSWNVYCTLNTRSASLSTRLHSNPVQSTRLLFAFWVNSYFDYSCRNWFLRVVSWTKAWSTVRGKLVTWF